MPRPLLFARLLQLIGILLAIAGLTGYWLTRGPEPVRLSDDQQQILGVDDDDFHAGFVVAGRDVFYGRGDTEPVYNEEGEIVCWRYSGTRTSYGVNTDTVIYAGLTNDELTMIMLPRDLFVGEGTAKINGVYARQGAQGLRSAVSGILGVPVNYHAIVNIDIFQRLVDAVGGVEVDVPVRMYHRDCTADLTIDLQPGLQHLDGEEASHFVRYRDLFRGDIDRLENVKTLAYALLNRLKELNVRSVGRLPQLLTAYYDEVETNVGLGLLTRQILPRLGSLTIQSAGTLPTVEVVHGGVEGMEIDADGVERFLAATFGGEARVFSETPDLPLLITDRSGEDGLAEWYRDRLLSLDVSPELISVREATVDGAPTRVVATVDSWSQAYYYSSLLGVGRQQVDRFSGARTGAGIELVLGTDAPGRERAQAHAPARVLPMND